MALDLFPDDPESDRPRPIATPREHGELLHAGGLGSVAIAQKHGKDLWGERSYPVEVAVELLNHYRGRSDVYLSTQRFRGRRRIAHLLSMGALFADLDYYRRPDLADAGPRRVLELALKTLDAADMPGPSLAISSGRGLSVQGLRGYLQTPPLIPGSLSLSVQHKRPLGLLVSYNAAHVPTEEAPHDAAAQSSGL